MPFRRQKEAGNQQGVLIKIGALVSYCDQYCSGSSIVHGGRVEIILCRGAVRLLRIG